MHHLNTTVHPNVPIINATVKTNWREHATFSFISHFYRMPMISDQTFIVWCISLLLQNIKTKLLKLHTLLILQNTHSNTHTQSFSNMNFNHIPRVISWFSLSWTLTGYAHHIWHVLLMRSYVLTYNMSHA